MPTTAMADPAEATRSGTSAPEGWFPPTRIATLPYGAWTLPSITPTSLVAPSLMLASVAPPSLPDGSSPTHAFATPSPTSWSEYRYPLGQLESGYAHQWLPVPAIVQTPPPNRLQLEFISHCTFARL